MEIRPIHNEGDRREALKEIERLWGAEPNTPDGDKLEVLAILVDAYEAVRWPVKPMTPCDMLKYVVSEASDMGRSERELAEILGSELGASELLSGRQKISLEEAWKINHAWEIPVKLLMAPYDDD